MKSSPIAMAIVLMVPLGGCALNRTDLVRSGYLTLEPQLTKPLLRVPAVLEEDGSLVIDGQIDASAITRGGHVDIKVVAPDGVVVYDAQVNCREHVSSTAPSVGRRARLQRQRARDHYHYSVRFPGLPPEGSSVRVVFDPLPHAEE